MNIVLSRLTADLERSLASRGFGVSAHGSQQDAVSDSTTLVIARDGRQLWTYRFEYRETVDDEAEWVDRLARQQALQALTAVYAVTRHVFSEHGEAIAARASVGLHEIAPEIRNRIVVVWPFVAGGTPQESDQPPLILTQRLKTGPATPRWFCRAAMLNDGVPVTDLVFEAQRDSGGAMQITARQGSSRPDGPDVRMDMCPVPQKATGLEECYARSLGDCDGISREHIISESVLKVLPKGLVVVSAAPDIPAGRKKAIGELKWPVLCRKHNRALSDIDKDGAAFFSTISDGVNGRVPAVGTRTSFVGTRLERWLLKVACGVCELESRDGRVAPTPVEWVGVLFGRRPWPRYFSSFWSEREGTRSHEQGFELVTTIDSVTGRPKGITLSGVRLSVTLALGSFDGVPGMRRPAGITVGLNNFAVGVELIWP
ncbi:MAG TPA: hypothetical protein VKZ18_20550 [Polyangia bacterium]|nr:hypothetical protein [Polyangia bacterium]